MCVPTACCKEGSTEPDGSGRCVSNAGCGAGGERLGQTHIFERVGGRMVEMGAM